MFSIHLKFTKINSRKASKSIILLSFFVPNQFPDGEKGNGGNYDTASYQSIILKQSKSGDKTVKIDANLKYKSIPKKLSDRIGSNLMLKGIQVYEIQNI